MIKKLFIYLQKQYCKIPYIRHRKIKWVIREMGKMIWQETLKSMTVVNRDNAPYYENNVKLLTDSLNKWIKNLNEKDRKFCV